MAENNLIGKKVMHTKMKTIGTIISVSNGLVEVSFRGQTVKYSFPAAFSSILELEDEKLQAELVYSSSEANFNEFKNLYGISINNEIKYLKETGGKRYRAIDGVRLQSQNGEYIYTFDTDTELYFPDGTSIKIWLYDSIISAYVMSCEEFTIMIRSVEYIGESLESIEFTAEQWQLLESLKERLNEMHPAVNSIAYDLACKGQSKIDKRKEIMCGQNYAVKRAATEPITFIWGPPGTGKTHTLANIALEFIEQGKRVLMLSYSNVSVDGALLRVANMSDCMPGQIIRYGYSRMRELSESDTLTAYQFVLYQNPELAAESRTLNVEKRKLKRKDPRRIEINKKLNKIRESLIEKEKELIQNAVFIATTVSKAVIDKALYTQSFDLVIFDEASMAYIPQVIFAAGLAKSNFVCLGDFRQLPAIVQNNKETRLIKDIFEYTGITTAVENDYGHDWLVMLNVQYRMHKDIAEFASKNMYGGRLRTAPEIMEQRQLISNYEPLKSEAMSLLDLSFMYSVCIKTMEGSRINLLSALICTRLAERFIDKFEVGIITPYSAQSRLVLAMIRDMQERDSRFSSISCATVHQFQGSEKPVIIYDAVDCFRMPFPGTLLTSFKNDTANRLFNVALTRAQGKFVLVANRDYLVRKKISAKLMFTKALDNMLRTNAYIDGDQVITELRPEENEEPKLYVEDRENTWRKYISDLLLAKKDICIDVPGLIAESDDKINELGKVLKNLTGNSVNVIIRTDENISLPSTLREYVVINSYVANPVTIIDKRIVWYGQPLAAVDFVTEGVLLDTEYFPCVRFEGMHTARALQAFLEF